MKQLLVVCSLCLIVNYAFADIAYPGEISRKVMLSNLDEFPEYEFYIKYQEYYYNEGHQPGEVIEKLFVPNESHFMGDHFASSKVYARLKGTTEEVAVTEEPYGGRDIVDPDIGFVKDIYKIQSVENGVITLVPVDTLEVLKNGKVKGEAETEPAAGQGKPKQEVAGVTPWYFWVLPSISLIALVSFFWFRAKRKQSNA